MKSLLLVRQPSTVHLMKKILSLLLTLCISTAFVHEAEADSPNLTTEQNGAYTDELTRVENQNISVRVNVDDKLSLAVPGYFKVYDPENHFFVARMAISAPHGDIDVDSLETDNHFHNKSLIGAKVSFDTIEDDDFTQSGLLDKLLKVGSDSLNRELEDLCAEYLVEMKQDYEDKGYKIIGSIDVYNSFIAGKIGICFKFLRTQTNLGNITEVTQYHVPLKDTMAHITFANSTDSVKAKKEIEKIRKSVKFF